MAESYEVMTLQDGTKVLKITTPTEVVKTIGELQNELDTLLSDKANYEAQLVSAQASIDAIDTQLPIAVARLQEVQEQEVVEI